MRNAFETHGTGPFNFYFGREFGQHAPVAFERSRREEDANFQSWIGVARSLPGTDKSAGLEDELAFGRAVFTGALARSFAEPAADVESVLSRDGFHPLAENIDEHRLRGAGSAVLVAFFVGKVAACQGTVPASG